MDQVSSLILLPLLMMPLLPLCPPECVLTG
jgi:hypothetical protein